MAWQPRDVFTTESKVDAEGAPDSDQSIKKRLSIFLRSFQIRNEPVYRDQLRGCVPAANPHIDIDLDHVAA